VTVLGIDPGASGGIALIGDCDDQAVKMPETERDTYDLIRQYAVWADVAIIEKVGAMPGNGVAGMFRFGQSYGFLRASLIASGIPFEAVTPAKWQRSFGLPTVKSSGGITAKKNRHKSKAQELWPSIKITHATADALLIARWRMDQ